MSKKKKRLLLFRLEIDNNVEVFRIYIFFYINNWQCSGAVKMSLFTILAVDCGDLVAGQNLRPVAV